MNIEFDQLQTHLFASPLLHMIFRGLRSDCPMSSSNRHEKSFVKQFENGLHKVGNACESARDTSEGADEINKNCTNFDIKNLKFSAFQLEIFMNYFIISQISGCP